MAGAAGSSGSPEVDEDHSSRYGPWDLALLAGRTLRELVDVALRSAELAFAFGHLRSARVGAG